MEGRGPSRSASRVPSSEFRVPTAAATSGHDRGWPFANTDALVCPARKPALESPCDLSEASCSSARQVVGSRGLLRSEPCKTADLQTTLMNVLFLISGYSIPSSRFRVLAFVPYLRRLGIRCSVRAAVPPKYDYYPAIGWRASQRLRRLVWWLHWLEARWKRFDTVVIQRELFDDDTWSMEARFRRVAPRLVLDVDDAVFLRHPRKFEQLARLCDRVIVGNQYLAEYVGRLNPDVVVIPTCVDLKRYPSKPRPARPDQTVVLGWIGTTGNLAYLSVVAPALRRLARRYQFRLHLVAGSSAPLSRLDLSGVTVSFTRWSAENEVRCLSSFDIGLMPLFAQSEWDRYKCGLKLLQYMAVGIPGVATPVGVNADIVRHGENGFLARTDEEWEAVLSELLERPELRQRVGQEARRTVERHYSLEANLPKLVDALR